MKRKSLQDQNQPQLTEANPTFFQYKDKLQWIALGSFFFLGTFMIVASCLIEPLHMISNGIGMLLSGILLISLVYLEYRMEHPTRNRKY